METSCLFLWNKFPEQYADVDPKKKVICINQGGTSCFEGDTLVHTSTGLKPIKDIHEGEFVLSHNVGTGENELKQVVGSYRFKNEKKTVTVRLKNGKSFTCTEDHLFFVGGAWKTIKELLSLWEQKTHKNEDNSEF
jgi:hypothetical protein